MGRITMGLHYLKEEKYVRNLYKRNLYKIQFPNILLFDDIVLPYWRIDLQKAYIAINTLSAIMRRVCSDLTVINKQWQVHREISKFIAGKAIS